MYRDTNYSAAGTGQKGKALVNKPSVIKYYIFS